MLSSIVRTPIVGCIGIVPSVRECIRLAASRSVHAAAPTPRRTLVKPLRLTSTRAPSPYRYQHNTILARAFCTSVVRNVQDEIGTATQASTSVESEGDRTQGQRSTLCVRDSDGLVDVRSDWRADPDALRALQARGRRFWLDIVQPDRTTLRTLHDVFGLHGLTVEDFENRESREKIEHFPMYQLVSYAAFMRTMSIAQPFKPVTFYILSLGNGTITLQSERTATTDGIIRRLSSESGPECLSPKWLLHASLDCVTDELDAVRAPFRRQIEKLSLDSLRRPTDGLLSILKDVVSARMETNAHRVLLGHKGEVLRKLIRQEDRSGGGGSVRTTADMHFQDVEDHLLNASQELSAWESALDRIETSLFARLQLTAAKNSEDSNAAMSQLTTLGTVLVPLNIITGLWGMNVNVPGQGAEGLLWFASLATSMAVVAACGYLFARRILRRAHK